MRRRSMATASDAHLVQGHLKRDRSAQAAAVAVADLQWKRWQVAVYQTVWRGEILVCSPGRYVPEMCVCLLALHAHRASLCMDESFTMRLCSNRLLESLLCSLGRVSCSLMLHNASPAPRLDRHIRALTVDRYHLATMPRLT